MFEHLKYVYYPDHDERYAHIPKEDRHEYPDEIVDQGTGETILKRKYTLAEVNNLSDSYTPPQLFGEYAHRVLSHFGGHIFAKDVPLSKAFEVGRKHREWNERMNQRMKQRNSHGEAKVQ